MKALFFCGLLLLFCFPCLAREGGRPDRSRQLPEVVVTAPAKSPSLTVPNLAKAKENLSRIPGGASIVDAAEYKKGRASTLQDTLGYSAGVFAQPRFGSEESRLSIRGSGLQRTFHLRGIKLLQDGVPINQADGGGDFQVVEPLALQYVEVFRGANALDYGSTTLGGAINFVSPTGRDASPLQARFEGGSFDYLRDQVSSGYAAGPADYFVSLSEFRQDGFRNHSDQWTKRFFSNYGLRFAENAETRFYVSAVDSKSKLPGNLTKAQMRQDPAQSAATNSAQNQKRDFDLFRLANKTVFTEGDHRLELSSFWIRKDLFHPIFQVLDVLSNDWGGMARYINTADIFGRKNLFTFGFNPMIGIAEDVRHVNAGGERGAKTADSVQTSSNLDFFAKEQFYALEKLALAGGLQWSLASRKTRDRFLSDGDHRSHPTYVGVSPKAGLRYEFTEQNQIFANFSRSFEPPSFGELSNVTSGGIRDLKPQTASTLEIGTRGEAARFSWDLAYYYSWVENELLSLNDGAGNPLGTVNAYGTRHQGIELGTGADILQGIFSKENPDAAAQAAPTDFSWKRFFPGTRTGPMEDRLRLRGIYNWSRFRFENDPAFRDNPLPGIPEHFIRAELVYEHPWGFYFGPNLEWTLKRYAVDMNNTLFADPYAIPGLKAGYKVSGGLSFFIEAKNLTHKIYAATTGVINNASGQDSAQFLPGDGRSVISGVEWSW